MRYLYGVLLLCLTCVAWGADAGSGEVTIKTALGTTFQGYVAGPEDATRAILLLPDRWGLSKTMRQWADRFAAKGYRVLAIDVADGRASDKMWLATEIMNAVDPEWIKQDMLGGLKYLAAPRRVIATVGEGLGGWGSFEAAILAPEQVAASVVIYGDMSATPKEAARIHTPVLGIFAKNDKEVTTEDVDGYKEMLLKPFSPPHRFITVDAGHGFMDPLYRGAYDSAKSDEAWKEIDSFLESNLGAL